jgi:ribonuclease P protein component
LKNRVGFVASKKVGNAVKRARAKRRMRALFFENQDRLIGGTYLFVAKEQINKISYDDLKRGFSWSLKRLECLK